MYSVLKILGRDSAEIAQIPYSVAWRPLLPLISKEIDRINKAGRAVK